MAPLQMAAVQAGMPPRKLSADEQRLAPHVLVRIHCIIVMIR